MSSIDRRVVEMEFKNKDFEAGVKETLSSLDLLRRGLSLDGISTGVDKIANRFSALGAVAFTVIQELTRKAMNFAENMGRMLLDPLISGGKRRAMNIEQARFQFRGLGIDAEKAMKDALYAVQGTAFGLDEAAKTAAQLSASQVQLGDDMKGALRGISGVAAMTNSSYEDISRIFTRVAGQGRVMAVDLNSIAARGLNAAATLADSLGVTEAEIREMTSRGEISFEMFAKAMDDAFGENATKANETYTGSLANMRAALARIGARFFTPWLEQQRDLFNAITPAIDSMGDALAPVIDLFSAFTGRQTNNLIRFINGIDFDRLYLLIAPLSAIIRNSIRALTSVLRPIQEAFRQIFPPRSIETINEVLKGIQAFTAGLRIGAETADRLRRVFAGVFALFSIGWTIVRELGRAIFNAFGSVNIGSGFLEGAASIGDFIVAINDALKDGEKLRGFFSGITDVISIALDYVRRLGENFASIFDRDYEVSEGLTTFLELMQASSERISIVWEGIVNVLGNVGAVIVGIFAKIGEFLSKIPGWIAQYLSSVDWGLVLSAINTSLFAGLIVILNDLGNIFKQGKASEFTSNFQDFLKVLSEPVGSFTNALDQVTSTLSTMQNTLRAFTLIQLAVAIGIMAVSLNMLAKIDAAGLTRALTAMGVLFLELYAMMTIIKIKGLFDGPGLVKAMIGLMGVAVAVTIFAAAVKILSTMDIDALTRGLSSLVIILGGIVFFAQGMQGLAPGLIRVGIAVTILGVGVTILAGALKILSTMDWPATTRGMYGLVGILGSLVIFANLMQGLAGGLIRIGIAFTILAVGIGLLTSSVFVLSTIDIQNLSNGLTALIIILGSLVFFAHAIQGFTAGLIRAGTGITILAVGVNLLAVAMKILASISWGDGARALILMAQGIAILVATLYALPKGAILQATALVVVASALIAFGVAMKILGSMGWEQIGKALITLGWGLGVIIAALYGMQKAILGAAALIIVAMALSIFAPAMFLLGGLSWSGIAKGLVVLAGGLLLLAVAGYLLTPVVGTFLALSAAFLLFGGGLALLGVGLALVAEAFGTIVKAVDGAIDTFDKLLSTVISLAPAIGKALAEGFMTFIETLVSASDTFVMAIVGILQILLNAITTLLPDVFDLFRELLGGLLDILVEYVPKIADAALQIVMGILDAIIRNGPTIIRQVTTIIVGFLREMTRAVPRIARAATDLMVAFLRSVRDNIDRVIRAGVDVIIAFIEGIADNTVRLANAAMRTLRDFLRGLADAIDRNAGAIRREGRNLARAIIDGITGGLASGVANVARSAREMATNAIDAARGIFRTSSPSRVFMEIGREVGDGLAIGIRNSERVVRSATEYTGNKAVDSMTRTIAGLAEAMSVDGDFNPTITPILDLSEVKKAAKNIDTTLGDHPLSVATNYSTARDASMRYLANEMARRTTTSDQETMTPETIINYNQYNTSPKALSSAEIYRQTKNQLSVTKGALKANAAE